MARFRIRASWTTAPADEEISPAERATFARVQISIDDVIVTRVDEPEDARPYVVGPASGLAEWIVESWIALLWETHAPFPKSAGDGSGRARVPSMRDAAWFWNKLEVDRAAMGRWQQRHTLGVAASDLALPSIVFLPEESAIGVFVTPLADSLDPTVRMGATLDDAAWVRVEDMRDALGSFVDDVIARARGANDADVDRWANWLEQNWKQAQDRERDPTERMRVALGEFAIQHWDAARATLHEDTDALRGILLDTPPVRDENTWQRRLEQVDSARRRPPRPATISWPTSDTPPGMPLYAEGQRLASRLRETMANPDAPVDLQEVAEALGIVAVRVDPSDFRSAAVRTVDGRSTVFVARDGVMRERFAMAAAIGRLLFGARGGSPVGAAHGRASRVRETQRSNAFAAELLLPAAALKARGTGDVRELCEVFGISMSAARWQIENRGQPARAD